MADGVYVAMAREIEHAIFVADCDPGPRELARLRALIERLHQAATQRADIIEGKVHERSRARLPYKDD